MLASRAAVVQPLPERNPPRNPLHRPSPRESSDTSSSYESSDEDASDEASDEKSARSSRQSRISSSSSADAPSDSGDPSDSSDPSDSGDELDARADYLLERRTTIGSWAAERLRDEHSMFPQALRTDNLGVLAWLIPATGVATMLGTEALACAYHFRCADNFPTLSYAATFKPEGYAFATGMCVTAVLIFVSVALFYWFLKLRGDWQAAHSAGRTMQQIVALTALLSGVTAAASLFGLAVLDMRNYHDAHIAFTVIFFIAAWATIISVHQARRMILHENDAVKGGESLGSLSAPSCGSIGDRPVSLITALRRWKRLKFATAYSLGKLLLLTGLGSTFLFGLLFLCVNGVWANPIGFTAVQEAFFEAFAIVCQLLFMGTLSCELSMLTRLVERQDYTQLERAE